MQRRLIKVLKGFLVQVSRRKSKFVGERKLFKLTFIMLIMEDMIKIPKEEYERLKMQADIDVDLLKQLVRSVKDIKEGRVIRVK